MRCTLPIIIMAGRQANRAQNDVERRYGIVVLLDVFGTKGRWRREQATDIISAYVSFADGIQDRFELETKGLRKGIGMDMKDVSIEVASFSDTFIVTISKPFNVNVANVAKTLVLMTGTIVGRTLFSAIEKDIPLRGGVSIGEFYISRRTERYMIIGQPIDECAEYHNQMQWIGVAAAPSAHNVLTNAAQNPNFKSRMWGRYDVPLKNGFEPNGGVIKWPIYYPLECNDEIPKKLEAIKNIMNENLNAASTLDIAFKWRHTRDFFNEVLDSEKADTSNKTG